MVEIECFISIEIIEKELRRVPKKKYCFQPLRFCNCIRKRNIDLWLNVVPYSTERVRCQPKQELLPVIGRSQLWIKRIV